MKTIVHSILVLLAAFGLLFSGGCKGGGDEGPKFSTAFPIHPPANHYTICLRLSNQPIMPGVTYPEGTIKYATLNYGNPDINAVAPTAALNPNDLSRINFVGGTLPERDIVGGLWAEEEIALSIEGWFNPPPGPSYLSASLAVWEEGRYIWFTNSQVELGGATADVPLEDVGGMVHGTINCAFVLYPGFAPSHSFGDKIYAAGEFWLLRVDGKYYH
jgi:hypothetical protein